MKILFVCRYNRGRSQMAEGFLNTYSKKHHAISAGTNPEERMHLPLSSAVIQCMHEMNIDVSQYHIKKLTPQMVEESDIVVMLTEKEYWPQYVRTTSKRVLFWDVPDGRGRSYEFQCMIRDKINLFVKDFLKTIEY